MLRPGVAQAEPRRSRSRLWRVEPINKGNERVLEAWWVGVWVLPNQLDHLAVAFGRLLVFTASLIDHAEAVPAVGLVGEASRRSRAATSAASSLAERTRSTTASDASINSS